MQQSHVLIFPFSKRAGKQHMNNMAPVSAAERQRKYRAKQKQEDLHEEQKAKNRRHNNVYREKQKNKLTLLKKEDQKIVEGERRLAEKLRKREYRKRKRIESRSSPSKKSGYSTQQSLSRATNKVKERLPKSPGKKREVVKMLFKQCNMREDETEYRKTRMDRIAAETVQKVKTFYERDDISRMAPGKRDVISVKTANGKEKLQRRHLYMSIKETHQSFLKENPEIHIGLTKFSMLRPVQVRYSSETPANVCTCIYHQNVILALEAMHGCDPTFPVYDNTFSETCILSPEKEECWYGKCSHESCGFEFVYSCPENTEDKVSWRKWEEINGRIIKNVKSGQVQDLYEYLTKIVPPFLIHCFVKRKQAESYENDKSEAIEEKSETMMLQVDFAENFTCVAQDEVQSAHWKQNQITLFTSVAWFRGSIQSEVIASDNLKHDKTAVIVFMDELLSKTPKEAGKVKIWSDGPNSQFKNRFVMRTLKFLSKKHTITIQWNFSATSHGKGPVDGVGATVKREAWTKVRSRQNVINNLDEFVSAVSGIKNIIVTKIGAETFEQRSEDMKLTEQFEACPAIPGISESHFVELDAEDNIMTRLYTSQPKSINDNTIDFAIPDAAGNEDVDNPDEVISVGQIVAVHLEGKKKKNIANVYMALVSMLCNLAFTCLSF